MVYHHRHSHRERRRAEKMKCKMPWCIHSHQQRMSSPKSTLCACGDGDGDSRVKPGGQSPVSGMSETFPFSIGYLQNETPITANPCLSQHYLLEEGNLLLIIAHQMERNLPKSRSHQGSLSIFNLHLRFLFCFVF